MLFKSPFLDIIQGLNSSQTICYDKGDQLTTDQLESRSIELARFLAKSRLKKGDKVLFACECSIEFLVLFMALVHLRVKIALVDPHMGRSLYWSKVNQLNPKYAFIDSRILLLQEHPILRWFYLLIKPAGFYIPFSRKYKVFATGIRLPLLQKHKRLKYDKNSQSQNLFKTSSEDDEIAIVYTSGTISNPKAVVHTVNTLFNSLKAISQMVNEESQGSIITHLPHFALIGMMINFKTYFWKEDTSARERYRLIEKNGITTLFGPPTEYLSLINYCEQNHLKFPSSLQHLILGSAPVLKPFLKKLRKYTSARITCLYGMTENLIVSSVDGDQKINSNSEGDLLGKSHNDLEYYINEDKELFVKSDWLFKRYYAEDSSSDFHATGDLVELDKQGNLCMLGRKKNMIIRGNKNIYPQLYEPIISSIPGVNESYILGIYNEKLFDEEVFLILDADPKMTTSEIRKKLQMGKYAIDSDVLPDHIVFANIPKKGRQMKADREKLIEIAKNAIK